MSDFQNEFGIDRGENKSKIQPTNKVGKDIPSNSIAGYTEEQLKDWLEKNCEKILKDYYHRGYNTFSDDLIVTSPCKVSMCITPSFE